MTMQEKVRVTRREVETRFPCPTAVDCVRFIFQELGEVDDCLMRLGYSDHQYLRGSNGHKDKDDLIMELGDVGVMWLTLCDVMGIDAQDAVAQSMEKIRRRCFADSPPSKRG